jgi:hypothetical protein
MLELVFALVCCVAAVGSAYAQASAADGSPPKTLAQSIDVSVVPGKGQDEARQSLDEAGCYGWAVEHAGNDPFSLAHEADRVIFQAEMAKQQGAQMGQGSGYAGALGGAGVGAVVSGSTVNDPSGGAAKGALIGGIATSVQAHQERKQFLEAAEAEKEKQMAVIDQQMVDFQKAFSTCLEAKGYTVTF